MAHRFWCLPNPAFNHSTSTDVIDADVTDHIGVMLPGGGSRSRCGGLRPDSPNPVISGRPRADLAAFCAATGAAFGVHA